MAGLLYLPRIFVYHVENYEKKQTTEIFEIMERWLYIYIIGFEALSYLWVQCKLILIILLTIYHEYLRKCMNALKLGNNDKSSKFFRIINEIPTVFLILIVFIVIFKPL